jgi:predicted DNA-binding transcriptional regulator AlpA
MENNPTYLKLKDIQKILPLGKTTIYKLFQLDGFPGMRIGSTYVVEKNEFLKWLKLNEGKNVNLP